MEDGRLFYTGSGLEITLLNPKIVKNYLISKLMGYLNRTSVEKFNNEGLYVERTSLPPVEDDEYYFEDLKGLKIVSPDKEDIIGEVTEVCDHGGGVFLEIRMTNGKIATIPFNKRSVLNVDINSSRIAVNIDMILI